MEAPRKRRASPARTAHKARRRELLLDAVADAVRDNGAGTSMDVIADAAGVGKPVLYRYFGSRHGLNLALAERFSTALTEELHTALAREAGPRALLRVSIDAYLAFLTREPELYRWLTQWSQTEHPQAVGGLMAQIAEEIGKLLHQRLEAAALDPAPAQWWAYGIVGMVHVTGDRWLDEGGIDRDELVDHLVTLLWSGISGYADGAGS